MYFAVEMQNRDKAGLLALTLSMHLTMKGSKLLLACSEPTFNYVTSFYKFDLEITHYNIEQDMCIPTQSLKNLRNAMVHVHETYDKAVYISPIIYVIKDLSNLIKQSSDQGIVCVKRDVDMGEDSAHYPLVLMVLNKGEKVLSAINDYLSDNEEVLSNAQEKLDDIGFANNDSTPEEIERISNERTIALKSVSHVSQNFLAHLSSDKSLVSHFDGSVYIDIFNFFAADKAWKMNDIGVGADIKLTKNNCYIHIAAPSPDIRSIPPNIIEHTVPLLDNIEAVCCFNDPRFHMVQNINLALSANRILIYGPKEDLMGDWSRKSTPNFSLYVVQLISRSNYLNYKQHVTSDYYRTGMSVLYDHGSSSLIKGDMFSGKLEVALLFNYDSKVLSDLEGRYKYVGIYTPYILILESFDKEQEKVNDTFTFDEGSKVHSIEKEYLEYLKDLSSYKFSKISDTTSKSHVVDCMKLGVVPVINEDCTLLEIGDLVSGDESWEVKSEKCKEYFSSNLTARVMATKLVNTLVEYQPRPPEPKKKRD